MAIRARLAFPAFICPVVRTGDLHQDGVLTAADTVCAVNCIFKSGALRCDVPALIWGAPGSCA